MADCPRGNSGAEDGRAYSRQVEHTAQTHDEAALWDIFRASIGQRQTPSSHTLRSYRTGLGTYLTYLNERRHCLSHPPALQGYADHLREKKVAAETARNRVRVATQLLKALSRMGALLDPPSLTVTLSAFREAQPTEAYTDAEVDDLLAHAHPEERVILRLALEGGLRTSEIAALRRDQVVLDEPSPHLVVQTPTGDKERVDLTPRLQQELRRWFGDTPTVPQSRSVTVGATQPYLDYTVKALCGRAGVPYKGLRALRLTAGARRYRETGDAHEVRQFLRLGPRAQVSPYAEATRLNTDPAPV